MCFGSERRAHHAREQAKRDASAMMDQQAQSYKELLALVPKPPSPSDYTPSPVNTKSKLDDTSGVRTARSKRKSALNMNKGVASLRIPLNTGGSTGGGVNVG